MLTRVMFVILKRVDTLLWNCRPLTEFEHQDIMKRAPIRIINEEEAVAVKVAQTDCCHNIKKYMRIMEVSQGLSVHGLHRNWNTKTPYSILKPKNHKGKRSYDCYDQVAIVGGIYMEGEVEHLLLDRQETTSERHAKTKDLRIQT